MFDRSTLLTFFFYLSFYWCTEDLLSSSPALFFKNMNHHFGPWIISHDILLCPIICHYCPIPLACLRTFWMFHWLIHIYCGEFTGNVSHFLYDLLNKSKTKFRCLPFEPLIYIYIPLYFPNMAQYSVVNPPLNHTYYSWIFYRMIVPTKICFFSTIVPHMIEVPVTSTF